jgi:hypothetical protein
MNKQLALPGGKRIVPQASQWHPHAKAVTKKKTPM